MGCARGPWTLLRTRLSPRLPQRVVGAGRPRRGRTAKSPAFRRPRADRAGPARSARTGKRFAKGGTTMPARHDDDVFCLAEIAAAARVSDASCSTWRPAAACRPSGRRPRRSKRWCPARRPWPWSRRWRTAAPWAPAPVRGLAVAPEVRRAERRAGAGLHRSPLLAGLAIAVIASLGWSLRAEAPPDEVVSHEPVRLVYLALPGPGGGGGGGGLRQKAAGAQGAARRGPLAEQPAARRGSCLRRRRSRSRRDPLESTTIVAPIASAPADAQTTPGVLRDVPPPPAPTPGPGRRRRRRHRHRAWGSAKGRARASATAPAAVWAAAPTGPAVASNRRGSSRKSKPPTRDEARRRNVSGEVEMEITIRRDGSVSDVRITARPRRRARRAGRGRGAPVAFRAGAAQGHAGGRDRGSVGGVRAALAG